MRVWDLATVQNVSACIPDDSDFELLMRQSWHVMLPEAHQATEWADGSRRPSSRASVSDETGSNSRLPEKTDANVTRQRDREDGDTAASVNETLQQLTSDWQYLQRLLFATANAPSSTNRRVPTVDDLSRKLGANRVWGDGNEFLQVRAFARALTALDRQLVGRDALLLAQRVALSTASARGADAASIGLVELHRWLSRQPPSEVSDRTTDSDRRRFDGVFQPGDVVSRVRHRLLQRIAASQALRGVAPDMCDTARVGLNGLQRCLSLLDTSGDKRLSKDELQVGLRKFGVDVTFHELDYLFTHFDADRSGCISVDEFLVGMRGDVSARRAALVATAFDRLDKDRDGVVTLQELAAAYDTSKHPDVVSGRVSAEHALRAFAAQWESANTRDGVVTRCEFDAYYANLSASIDSDDYFELMMRNAWHLPGGDGMCANSANRRVPVTNDDGSQRVEVAESDRESGSRRQEQRLSTARTKTDRVVPGRAVPGQRRVLETRTPSSSASVLPGTARASVSSRRRDAASASMDASSSQKSLDQQREAERNSRHRAAELIQRRFRGFQARQFVACVKRKLMAERQRVQQEATVHASGRKRVLRAALRTYHGF